MRFSQSLSWGAWLFNERLARAVLLTNKTFTSHWYSLSIDAIFGWSLLLYRETLKSSSILPACEDDALKSYYRQVAHTDRSATGIEAPTKISENVCESKSISTRR